MNQQSDKKSPWIIPLKVVPAPALTIYTFHYAGGAAAVFSAWPNKLPENISVYAVQLPGRWERYKEPFIQSATDAATEIYNAVINQLPSDYMFIGYSMGSLIAYELTQLLQKNNKTLPKKLLALSRNAPMFVYDMEAIYQYPDKEFIEMLQLRYGAVPWQVLKDPELLGLFLPIIRADMKIFETYKHEHPNKISVPIDVWAGKLDLRVTIDGMKMWETVTSREFTYKQFNGPHFFTDSAAAEFFPELCLLVEQCIGHR